MIKELPSRVEVDNCFPPLDRCGGCNECTYEICFEEFRGLKMWGNNGHSDLYPVL